MSTLIESYVPVVKFNGLNTDTAVVFGSTLAVTGASTFTGTVTFNGGSVENTEVVLATNVITAAESGKTFYLSAAAGFVSTLPTAAAGLNFKFVVKTAPTTNGYTIVGTPVAIIQGTVAANGAEDTVNGVAAVNEDNVILVHNEAEPGDWVEFNSDGTNWYVTGQVNTFAAITANT